MRLMNNIFLPKAVVQKLRNIDHDRFKLMYFLKDRKLPFKYQILFLTFTAIESIIFLLTKEVNCWKMKHLQNKGT